MATAPDLNATVPTDPPETTGAKQAQAKSQGKDKPPPRKRGGARPGAGRPAKGAATAAEDKIIREALTQLLFLPSVPMGMLGHTWPAEHISSQAPAFAEVLVEQSRLSPQLRKLLLDLTAGGTYAALLIGGLSYSLPVVLYFATAADHPMRTMLGIPPRPGQPIASPPPMSDTPAYAAAATTAAHTNGHAAAAGPAAPGAHPNA